MAKRDGRRRWGAVVGTEADAIATAPAPRSTLLLQSTLVSVVSERSSAPSATPARLPSRLPDTSSRVRRDPHAATRSAITQNPASVTPPPAIASVSSVKHSVTRRASAAPPSKHVKKVIPQEIKAVVQLLLEKPTDQGMWTTMEGQMLLGTASPFRCMSIYRKTLRDTAAPCDMEVFVRGVFGKGF